jgi:CheY-like chemotaxis protein
MSESDGKVNILLVDDRPEKLLSIEAVLEDLGQNIVRAYSGREALRHVLAQEFAVILLDVNMPGMDGFETASLIRQRKNSEHVPIIFITAFGDEMLASRGYSLGAVDYILTPVVPEVLRSKVSVFVDLFKKTEQVRRQAETLRRRAGQMQKLAAASVAINSALSIDKMLQTVTDTARDVIGSHQAITLFIDPRPGQRQKKAYAHASYSERYAEWRGQPLQLDSIADTAVFRSYTATRMSEAELLEHPDWEIVRKVRIPPIRGGMLAAPLTGRDGSRLGVVYL